MDRLALEVTRSVWSTSSESTDFWISWWLITVVKTRGAREVTARIMMLMIQMRG